MRKPKPQQEEPKPLGPEWVTLEQLTQYVGREIRRLPPEVKAQMRQELYALLAKHQARRLGPNFLN